MLLNMAHTGLRWGRHCQAFKSLKGAINKGPLWFFSPPTSHSSTCRALPTFTEESHSRSQEEVSDGGWRQTQDGEGEPRRWWGGWEARPPLDKLELQTVETREIRMEPSLLGCDPEDGEGSDASSLSSPFFVVLICFCLARSKAGGNEPKWWA